MTTPEEQALLDQQIAAEDTGAAAAEAGNSSTPVQDFLVGQIGFPYTTITKIAYDAAQPFGDPNAAIDPAADIQLPLSGVGQETLANLQGERARSNLQDPAKKIKSGPGTSSVVLNVTPPVPPELLDQQQAIEENRAGLRVAYQTERAKSLGVMIDLEQDFQHGYKTAFEKTSNMIDGLLDEAELEAQGIGELIDRAASNQINPNQFFANVGDAGRFASALAVGAGAMASAFGGGPNVAHDIITRAIDRNVRAQIANQTHNRLLAREQASFVNTIRGLSRDRIQYGNYLRIGMTAMAKSRMAEEMNRLGQTGAMLAAQDVYLKFASDVTSLRIKANTNMAARVTHKFKSVAGADAYLAAKGFAGQQKQQAALATRRQRRPGGGGGGRSAASTTGVAKESNPQMVRDVISQLEARQNELTDDQKLTSAEFVRAAAKLLQDQSSGNVRGEDRELFRDIFEASPLQEFKNAARSLSRKDFRPADFKISLGTKDNVGFHIVDEELYRKNRDPGALSRAVNAVADIGYLQRLIKEGGNIAPDISLLKDVLIDVDGNATASVFFSRDKAKRRAQINQLVNQMTKAWHLENTDNARNALNLEWERRFAEAGAGVHVTVLEFIADWFRKDTVVSVARLGKSEEDRVRALRQKAEDQGLDTDFLQ